MPVYKDEKRGTWYVKYSFTDHVTGKRKQILKRGFTTKREATKWEAQDRVTEVSPTSITFRELALKYYDYRKPKERTAKDQLRAMEIHFPYIGTPVDKISKQKLMDWYIELTNKELSVGTINLILTLVKSVFSFGSEFYDLPNHSSSLKRLRSKRRKYDVWTIEEFNQFIQYEEHPLFKAAFTFLYWTGVRRGELVALKYTDFKDGKVHIQRQLTKAGISDLKTETSDRVLKLPDTVQACLKPILERCSEDRPFVFGSKEPLPFVTLYDHFRISVELSGVQKIRIHDLRHSFATNAICSGASIVAVSKYLGHSSITITLNTYTHLLEKTDDEMIEIMNLISKTA